MSRKEVRTIEIVLTIDIDADELENLPEVDGYMSFLGESQTPISGAQGLQNKLIEACIKASFEAIHNKRLGAKLNDATSTIGERYIPIDPFDAFY
jgi:hypothetical protein